MATQNPTTTSDQTVDEYVAEISDAKPEASETDGLKPKRTRARKTPAKAAKVAKAAPVAKTSARSTYPAEITEAVRLAKVARGMSKHAPGAKQHVMVRAEVGVDATAADVVKASGAKSERQLRALADGSAPTADVAVLRPLGAKFDDPFCKGRNLASILVAMVDQAKAKS
jgi:hypothetical protein